MIVVFTLILSTIFIAFIISCCQKLIRDHKIIRVRGSWKGTSWVVEEEKVKKKKDEKVLAKEWEEGRK